MYHKALLLILIANSCQQKQQPRTNVARVMNGQPAQLGDVPFQVSFKVYSDIRAYSSFCGGTIIGPNKLLSAAHCFVKEDKDFCHKLWKGDIPEVPTEFLDRVFAVAGNMNNTVRWQNFGQWRRLKSMYVPADYSFPNNDISVGFTRESFNFNSYVSSIPYAIAFGDYSGYCLVSGYGQISPTNESDFLQLAPMEVLPLWHCTWLHHVNMHDFVCTSGILSDVGKGDSGGPLVCAGTDDPAEKDEGVLIGVVSGNRRGCGSFFTRVSSFRGFIDRGGARKLYKGVVWIAMCLLHGGVLLFLFCFIVSGSSTLFCNSL